MTRNIIIFFLIYSCSAPIDKNTNITVPKNYVIHLRWDGKEKLDHNFFYSSNENGFLIYLTDTNYLVSRYTRIIIRKTLADSLYRHIVNSSNFFYSINIDRDSSIGPHKLEVTIRQHNKKFVQSYQQLSTYLIDRDMEQFAKIVRQLTKDSSILVPEVIMPSPKAITFLLPE